MSFPTLPFSLSNLCSSSAKKISHYLLAGYSAFGAYRDPERDDLVALLGETAPGTRHVLSTWHSQLLQSNQGLKLLENKPLVNSQTLYKYSTFYNKKKSKKFLGRLDLNLLDFPNNSFGACYSHFMTSHGYHPDDRAILSHFSPDHPHKKDLQWLLIRYRQIHDFIHTLTNVETSVDGELAVKWLEWYQTSLPSTLFASFFGSLQASNPLFSSECIPWAQQSAAQSKFLIEIPYEEYFYLPIEEVQSKTGLGLTPPPESIRMKTS